ncbi:hypothetical protein PtrSN002B_001755 [Pyrenophora tritici-repentis]|nr:hypothetical protein PtrSN002B_001755 [Pyrenophora tritici-repentis]KAI1580034.1 hypothetical protein PtrEW4_000250 [Pyrenophora tritici-repentis]KAI2486044.1 hypothetical protein Ptr902_00177 [Pyrenophora tritici-repentis]
MGILANDLKSIRESAPSEARPTVATRIPSTPGPDHGIMALPNPQLTQRASEYGSDIEINSIATPSDYGSDIDIDIDIDDDTILADAFETINQGAPAEKPAVLPSVEFEEGELEDEEQDVDGFVQIHRPALLRVAKGTSRVDAHVQRETQSLPMRQRTTLEVEYDEISRRAWSGTLLNMR